MGKMVEGCILKLFNELLELAPPFASDENMLSLREVMAF